MEKAGKAYAFFYCEATKEEIEKELPGAREFTRAPNELELKVTRGINVDDFDANPELRNLVQEAMDAENNYSIVAALPHSTNKDASDKLVSIQNALYGSPLQEKFHRGNDKFIGGTFYESEKGYVFAE